MNLVVEVVCSALGLTLPVWGPALFFVWRDHHHQRPPLQVRYPRHHHHGPR